MAKQNLRAVPCSSSLQGAVEDGYARLEELRDECQEIVDNASDSLRETQRIQTLEETANQLSGADDMPEVPEALDGVVVCYTEDRRKNKSHSRATRCAEAVSLLYYAKEASEEWLADNAEHESTDDVQNMIDSIDEMISNAESCEFPGMFG
jgi:Rad3-related DNA helicase